MAIDSLFILNSVGAPLLEKHWCDDLSTQRAGEVILPAFTRYLQAAPSADDAEPIWSSPLETVCIHIQRGELIYLGIISHETSPLEILELLDGIVTALKEYIGEKLNELTIKENFTTVYQLLSEMVDSGNAVTSDISTLKGIVPIPSLVGRVFENVSGIGLRNDTKPNINTSSTPWRAQGIRHTNNEIFVDMIDQIDAIVEGNGTLVSYDITSDVMCRSRLSGMPELLMSLSRPETLDDVTFHSSVRLAKWESDKSISFIPPDGQFKLASFHINSDLLTKSLPIFVHAVHSSQGSLRTVELLLEAGQCGGKDLENIHVRIPLQSHAYNIRVQCKLGTHTVDNIRHPQIIWNVKKLRPGERNSRLVVQYATRVDGSSIPQLSALSAFINFEILGHSVSNIKVESLKMFREEYKLFKGVRYITKAGSFQIRF